MTSSVEQPASSNGSASAASPPALELRGVTGGYGRTTVLRDVSITVPASGVAALLGPTHALKHHRAATPGCACQQRAGIIDQVRLERRAGTVA